MLCIFGLAIGMRAQNNKAARSVHELRHDGCGDSYFHGNTWDVTATFETTYQCEGNSCTNNQGDVYIVVASYHCRTQPCPAIADVIIGRVYWCGNHVARSECLQP